MIYRGVPSLYVFILPVGTLDLLFGGGGGGGVFCYVLFSCFGFSSL